MDLLDRLREGKAKKTKVNVRHQVSQNYGAITTIHPLII